jgi:hypothetical protein
MLSSETSRSAQDGGGTASTRQAEERREQWLLITTLAGTASDYMRFHSVFSPLLVISIWSVVLLTGEALFSY